MRYAEIQARCLNSECSCSAEEALKLSRSSFIMRKKALGYYPCDQCGYPMEWLKNRGKTDAQHRSLDQEKRAAKRYSMKRQPGSGSMGHAKSDLTSEHFRGELKETTRKSFSVKLDILEKIEKECEGGQHPFLEVEFQGVFPHKRYVVLPDWVFKWLKELSEEEA